MKRRSFYFRLTVLLTSVAVVCLLILATTALASGPASTTSDPASVGQTKHLTMMIVYAATALGFSFLCSVAEAVLLSISPSYIANLAKSGKQATADLLTGVKANIDRSLAAILTINTIAHTVGAGGAGAEAAAYFGEKYVGASMAVLTLLILFLSEIIPKTIGAVYWRSLAPLTGQFVRLLTRCLLPLLFVSELVTRWISRGKSLHQFSRDEFAALVDVGAEAGKLDPTESRILNNLFRFPDLCAEDIMTPRTVAFTLHEELTVKEVFELDSPLTFSRIPIYANNRDEVTGFVLKIDLLTNQLENAGKASLRDLKREIHAVHERTPLSQVLENVLDNKAHILLVVDNYGGMEGILTLEDVVETLIGIEIVDEADTIDDMRKLARQKWEERMKRVGINVQEPH